MSTTALETVKPSPVSPVQSVAMTPQPAPVGESQKLKQFTVAEYHRLIKEGFFAPEERLELIRGYIVHKMSRDPIHDSVIEIAAEVVRAALPKGWRIRWQMAVTMIDSQPEPDVTVVRGEPQERFGKHPGPGDLALAVEVSNTTVASDRGLKGTLYAECGLPIYWVINVPDRRIEVFTDPTGPDPAPGYRRREDFPIGTQVPIVIDGQQVGSLTVADLFPKTIES